MAETSLSPVHSSPTTHRRRGRWLWWLLAVIGIVVVLVTLAQRWLDPWLQHQLEKQVTTQTQGQYRLQVAGLETNLWQGAVRLRGLRLRPAAQVADTLPRLRLSAARLHITGVGLLALLRRGTVSVDSIVLDSVRLQVLALPRKSAKPNNLPLHQHLPMQLTGLEISYLGLQRAQLQYAPGTQPTAQVQQADIAAHDLHLTAAGAADSLRLAYAANWQARLLQAQAQTNGHQVATRRFSLSTEKGRLAIDSLHIQPLAGTQRTSGQPRVTLALPHLVLSGFRTADVQQKRLHADSLLINTPQVVFKPAATPSSADWRQTVKPYLSSLRLAHLRLRKGTLRVAGTPVAPVLRGINLTGTGIRLDSLALRDQRQILFATSWQAALGPSEARAAGHQLRLQKLALSTTAGTVSLNGVRVVPPKAGQGKAGSVRVNLALPSLMLTGWRAAELQHQQRLRIATVQVQAPQLTFTPPAQAPPPIWKLLSPYVRRAELQKLLVRNANVRVVTAEHTPAVRKLNLTGTAIRIDSVAAVDAQRIAYARAWQADAGRISTTLDAPFYQVSSQRARLNTSTQTLQLEGIALKPAFSPVQMNRRKGHQAPAVSLQLKTLAATGLDFAALAQQGRWQMQRLVVQSPVLRISSDGRGPINPNRSTLTPEEMRKLAVVVDVRRLDIRNGNVYSRYRSPLTPLPGTISINRFNGTFRNLSNDPRRQTPATPLTGSATTYLQNRCRLDAQVSMYLLDPQGRHRVTGTFGPGPFAMLNSMTVPTRLVKFKQGQVRRIRFALQADRKRVTGTMKAEYSGLQLTLLNFKPEEVEIKKSLLSKVKSKVVNFVAIRDQNPRKRGKLVEGEMTSVREPRFSMFTLWRQGVVSGLFHSVGLPQALAQKISQSKDEAPLPK